jgi:hypothetical protein
MEHTKRQLFGPFRWNQWWRLALLGLATGEMSSSGGCGGGMPSWPSSPPQQGDSTQQFLSLPPFLEHLDPKNLGHILLLAGVGLLVFCLLMLAILYIRSVCRFILIEALIENRCQVRVGWRKWRKAGRRLFLWELVYQIVLGVALVIVVGIPLGIAFVMGWLQQPREHLLPLILGGTALFLLLLVFLFFAVLVHVLAKDFLAPVMAVENLDFGEGWSRVLAMMKTDKMGYTGYIGMKIVLAIAAAIVFGILGFILLLIILIPVAIVAVAVGIAGAASGLHWTLTTISLAVIAGSIVVLFFLAVSALLSVPVAVFFPAYALHFFAARYPALHAWLHPAPLPPTPEPPPMPPLPPLPEAIG